MLSTSDSRIWLMQAIIQNPLIVAPSDSVALAITMMNVALTHHDQAPSLAAHDLRSSCVIVLASEGILGILSARDVLLSHYYKGVTNG